MTDMIEKVGRALADADGYAYDQVPYDRWARAAIEAIGQPAMAMARIQDAIAKYLHPTGGNKDQFIAEVLAAADDKEVVRSVRAASRPSSISHPSTARPDAARRIVSH